MLFTLLNKGHLFDLGSAVQAIDVEGTTDKVIPAYYRTAWFTAEDTSLRKRWRRPSVTAAADDSCDLYVDVYHDFDESGLTRTLHLPINSASGDMVWGDDWGSEWAGNDPVYAFDRLASPGRSNAIQMLFRVENVSSRWWVDSIALPYYQKPYR